MHKKILAIKGIQKLSKKQQANEVGGYGNSCPSNSSGYTGQSCTTALQCTPYLPGFPVACLSGCCISAF